jgi:hypothetical protein
MEAFGVRPMSRCSPLKSQFYPVILVVLATGSFAYQHPDTPTEDNRFALSSLQLGLPRPIQSSIEHQGDNAAIMQYKLNTREGFSISSSYSTRMENPFDTSGEIESDGFWDLSLSTPQSGALPGINIDFSYGGFDGDSGEEFGDDEHRMLKIKTNGKFGMLDHGFSYNIVGAEYNALDGKKQLSDSDKDKEAIESWLGKSFGDMSISQFVKQSESNSGLRNESLVGTRAEYTWSDWPYIGTSFSRATGTREHATSSENDLQAPKDGGFQVGITSISGSLSTSHDTWNADLHIDRTTVDEPADQSYGQPDSTMYWLGGSFYPNNSLSLTPSISYTQEDYRDYVVETQTVSTSLSLSYYPSQKNYGFNAYVSSDTQQNLNWGMDTHYFYSEAGIEWDLSNRGTKKNLMSLTFGYERYDDKIDPGSNMDDFSVKLSFKSYSLGSILRSRNRSRDNSSQSVTGFYNSPIYGSSPIYP